MNAAKQCVDSPARQRQLVLDKHLNPVEPCVMKVAGENGKAAFPRTLLGRRGSIAMSEGELLDQRRHQGVGGDLGTNSIDRVAVERHDSSRKAWKSSRPGWRLVISDSHCRAERITRRSNHRLRTWWRHADRGMHLDAERERSFALP